jgi:hypothetical protein
MATPVTTPAPESTSLREALGQARAEVNATPADSGTAATPAAATPAAADLGEFIENATAEEIAQIQADPVLSKLYNSMRRDYKAKTGSVAEQRRAVEAKTAEVEQQRVEADQALQLLDALRTSPKAVIEALAVRNGMTVAEAAAAVKGADTDSELVALFGDDAAAAQPLLDSVINKRALAVVDQKLGPIIQHLNAEADRQLRAEVASDVVAFQAELAAKGEEITPELEAEMNRLTGLIDPAQGTTNRQFLEMIYKIASSGKTAAAVTQEVTDRMRKAVRGREPAEIPSGSTGPGTAITEGMSLRESLRVARGELKHGR